MSVEAGATVIGFVLVAVGIWFYVGNGWHGFRNDFFLTYFFMAIPMGLGFLATALARSGIAGGASPLFAWTGVALLVIAILLAFTKPAKLAPRWLRTTDDMEGPAARTRPRWVIWYALFIAVAVVSIAAVIEWEKVHGG